MLYSEVEAAVLAHYGVKGMRWGVRKDRPSYATRMFTESPGASKTKVTTKNGETISIEKQRPGPLAVAVGRLTGRKPESAISAMVIRDSHGKKAGSFQIWREGKDSVRGEWLEVNPSHQGRGYSKAALQALIVAARRDGQISTVRLQVPADAAPAKHIYTQLGFTQDRVLGDTAMFGVIEDWVLRL